MSAFAQWLIGFAQSFIIWLCNKVIDIVQLSMDTLVDFLISVVSLFPAGEAAPSVSGGGEFMGVFLTTINWIFPMGFLVDCVAWLCAGMILYVIIAPLARWAKLLT